MHTPAVAELYDLVLSRGHPGVDRYYAALRARGIATQPDPARGGRDLYVPNPVIVSGQIVDTMVADANAFCAALRDQVPDGAALLARAPDPVRERFASSEVADWLVASMRRAHPLICLDAFLVAMPQGLQPRYLEWQTVGTYVTLGRWVLECVAEVWPELAERSPLTATRDLSLEDLGARLKALYLAGIEDDPRTGVVVDYRPAEQPTRREFQAIQELTGGRERGMGIVDAREIVLHNGQLHYRRDGTWVPVRRVYSRLVYSDMQRMLDQATHAESGALARLFGSAEPPTWINHPLHFFYGSKADFPLFWQRGLSAALPPSWRVTEAFVGEQEAMAGAQGRLAGYVLKPADLQSGQAVQRNPRVADLRPGWVLQREIEPAACHPTLWGSRTPEVRAVCLPGDGGALIGGMIYTRVKAPEVFLSNAGHTADLNLPGTGEGYAVVVWD